MQNSNKLEPNGRDLSGELTQKRGGKREGKRERDKTERKMCKEKRVPNPHRRNPEGQISASTKTRYLPNYTIVVRRNFSTRRVDAVGQVDTFRTDPPKEWKWKTNSREPKRAQN